MHDALLVRGFERVGDLRRHRQRLVERERSPGDPLGQRRAFDQFEHERGAAGALLDAVNAGDAGMIQRREHLRLAAEPRQPIGVAGHARRQDLHGHVAAQPRIAGAIDLAHPAAAQQRDDLIRPDPISGSQQAASA